MNESDGDREHPSGEDSGQTEEPTDMNELIRRSAGDQYAGRLERLRQDQDQEGEE